MMERDVNMTSRKMKLSQLSKAVSCTLDILQDVQYGNTEGDLSPNEEILLSDLLTVLDDIQRLDPSL